MVRDFKSDPWIVLSSIVSASTQLHVTLHSYTSTFLKSTQNNTDAKWNMKSPRTCCCCSSPWTDIVNRHNCRVTLQLNSPAADTTHKTNQEGNHPPMYMSPISTYAPIPRSRVTEVVLKLALAVVATIWDLCIAPSFCQMKCTHRTIFRSWQKKKGMCCTKRRFQLTHL